MARHLRDVLLLRARAVVDAIAHDPDLVDCADAGCVLADGSDHERCALVHRLAVVDRDLHEAASAGDEPEPGGDGGDASADGGLEAALREFDTALTDAIDAVQRCRQIEHGSGRCWFSAVPHVDGCGEVLRAAHRIG